LKHIKKVHTPM